MKNSGQQWLWPEGNAPNQAKVIPSCALQKDDQSDDAYMRAMRWNAISAGIHGEKNMEGGGGEEYSTLPGAIPLQVKLFTVKSTKQIANVGF